MRITLIVLAALSFACTSCWFETGPDRFIYQLSWFCAESSCERGDDLNQFNRAETYGTDFAMSSTSASDLATSATIVVSATLGRDCRLVLDLVLFGHELDESILCFTPNGFELTVTIPDEDPETSSTWVVMAREL
ncbi:hypothetical protein [Haliangium ochraceum]|uniref:Lipoprotein n=1 Tax=Haliangium ochraceum (strain DSM 14365 / JCM 11303 / SMP-2) TaxID=502025 RepID=D0LM14_HALO1|nr:hypothetical protein [Haliangium ochraceum]ACY15192.1 hypothetical protein Hoch_2661 [Haliangium ochraceum DSM 14365]